MSAYFDARPVVLDPVDLDELTVDELLRGTGAATRGTRAEQVDALREGVDAGLVTPGGVERLVAAGWTELAD